jgi:hypothetical protein
LCSCSDAYTADGHGLRAHRTGSFERGAADHFSIFDLIGRRSGDDRLRRSMISPNLAHKLPMLLWNHEVRERDFPFLSEDSPPVREP